VRWESLGRSDRRKKVSSLRNRAAKDALSASETLTAPHIRGDRQAAQFALPKKCRRFWIPRKKKRLIGPFRTWMNIRKKFRRRKSPHSNPPFSILTPHSLPSKFLLQRTGRRRSGGLGADAPLSESSRAEGACDLGRKIGAHSSALSQEFRRVPNCADSRDVRKVGFAEKPPIGEPWTIFPRPFPENQRRAFRRLARNGGFAHDLGKSLAKRLNVNGGAPVRSGPHPIGATGARLIVHAAATRPAKISGLRLRRACRPALCIGGEKRQQFDRKESQSLTVDSSNRVLRGS